MNGLVGVDANWDVVGWAYNPYKSEVVELTLDGEVVVSATANKTLEEGCGPREARQSGFRLRIPSAYRAFPERLSLRLRSGGKAFEGIELTRPQAPESRRVPVGHVEADSATGQITGWVEEQDSEWSRPDCRLIFNAGEELRFQAGNFGAGPKEVGGVKAYSFRLRVPRKFRQGKAVSLSLLNFYDGGWVEIACVSVVFDEACSTALRPCGPRKVIVYDGALIGPRGHVWNVASRLAQAGYDAGLEVAVVAGESFGHDTLAGRPCHSLLKASPYHRKARGGLGSEMDNLNALSPLLQADLQAFVTQFDLTDTLVLFPTVNQFMLRAFSDWLPKHKPKPGEFLSICLMLESGLHLRNGKPQLLDSTQAAIYQSAFERLAKQPYPHVEVGAISETLRAAYQAISPIAVGAFPSLMTIDPASPIRPSVKSPQVANGEGKLQVGLYLGEVKEDKGFFLIADVLECMREKGEGVEFHVQAHANTHNAVAIDGVKRRLAASGAAVTVYEEFLGQDEYEALMRRLDLVVIAYDPEHYSAKTSGAFWESSSLGISMVVPANTWMHQEAKATAQHFHTFDRQEPKDIASATDTMIGRMRIEPRPECQHNDGVRPYLLQALERATVAANPRTSSLLAKLGNRPGIQAPQSVRIRAGSKAFTTGWGKVHNTSYVREARWLSAEGEVVLDLCREQNARITLVGEGTLDRKLLPHLGLFVDGQRVPLTTESQNRVSWRSEGVIPRRQSKVQWPTRLVFRVQRLAEGDPNFVAFSNETFLLHEIHIQGGLPEQPAETVVQDLSSKAEPTPRREATEGTTSLREEVTS